MKNTEFSLIVDYENGRLSPDESVLFELRLERSPELKLALMDYRQTRSQLCETIKSNAASSVQPFFTDRLMRKINKLVQKPDKANLDEEFLLMLLRQFRPVLVIAALIIVFLIGYNVRQSSVYEAEQSATEAVLGLPPVTLATAYDVDNY